MSELINKNRDRTAIRWKLLLGASSLTLTCCLGIPLAAKGADDNSQPVVWIELGGQVERLDTDEKLFEAPFFATASPKLDSTLRDSQRRSANTLGEEGKLTFEPKGSKWKFSVSLLYGRSSMTGHTHYETPRSFPETLFGEPLSIPGAGQRNEYADGAARSSESHTILDFKAGKDVGLGMFGEHSSSVISAGVRYAQMNSNIQGTLRARPHYTPGPYFVYTTPPFIQNYHFAHFQNNKVLFGASRNSHFIGPAVSWDASVSVAGNSDAAEMTVDWGVNAAVLFGRQRAHVHHQTSEGKFYSFISFATKTGGYTGPSVDKTRSRAVTIPNIGGKIGISLKVPNAKISFGYRADFFFNAIDNGIDTRQSENVGFYGPFATISIGLGG